MALSIFHMGARFNQPLRRFRMMRGLLNFWLRAVRCILSNRSRRVLALVDALYTCSALREVQRSRTCDQWRLYVMFNAWYTEALFERILRVNNIESIQ